MIKFFKDHQEIIGRIYKTLKFGYFLYTIIEKFIG
ncbi:hypothetical protein I582_02107 [Enterococcus casseliflavus ATCC 49996]|nr:hypothetical protein I582_02107 [Enterococcus casseliflavus ATCC 49996]